MEARKKRKPITVILIVLAALLLVFCCCVSLGVTNFQPFDLRYGLRLVGENSLTGALARGEFVLLDRDAALQAGSVVYLPEQDVYQGVSMKVGSQVKLTDGTTAANVIPVHSKLSLQAPVLCFLQDYPVVSLGAAAAFLLLLITLKATAPSRWRKRQQKLIRENFAKFGAQYAKEEEDLQY